MSFSEMKVSARLPSDEASRVFFCDSSVASLRFAALPPPRSTAAEAALIRRSLRRAKSAGVRIYDTGKSASAKASHTRSRHTFVVASVDIRLAASSAVSSLLSSSASMSSASFALALPLPFDFFDVLPSSSSLSLISRSSSLSESTEIHPSEDSSESDSTSQPSQAASSSSPSSPDATPSSSRSFLR